MRAVMTVAFVVNVPDDTDLDDLSMEVDYDTITLSTGVRNQVSGEVISHSTESVEKTDG